MNIRNFCIIAHIDHGKSTLADRLLELTGTISKRDMQAQFLDSMSLERERGVTIKMHPVTMFVKHRELLSTNNELLNKNLEISNSKLVISDSDYVLNLIDTPGHVDFSYEVSRSLAAVEGAVLLVDASQGVQAQTLANLYQAMEHDLVIIPVLNKIDLPGADIETSSKELEDLLGVDPNEILKISAKEGTGVEELLFKIIQKIPAPKPRQSGEKNLSALVFDSVYDSYRGVILYVRLFAGEVKKNDQLLLMGSKTRLSALEVGIFRPKLVESENLQSGSIGYIVTDLREVAEARVGETVTHEKLSAQAPLAGLKEVIPYVFASFFPASQEDFPKFKDALSKLHLSDASFSFVPEAYGPLGHGYSMGFLGLFHLDIIHERLSREYDLELITTMPHASYRVKTTTGQSTEIKNPTDLPDPSEIAEIAEPWVKIDLITPSGYIGKIMELGQSYNGIYKKTEYLETTRAHLTYEFPLSKILSDFYDRLKSASQGYASMNYEMIGYRVGDLVKLDILVAGELVEPLSQIINRADIVEAGKKITSKLKDLIPKQHFKIAIQAAVGSNIVAREDISPIRKDVTAKLYGGDVTRKRKLLEKQKKGKKKMRQFGNVEIPSEVFVKLMRG